MIKVQQTKQNECFLQEAGDYLKANGYTRSEGEYVNGCIYFTKADKSVIVHGDNVDFLIRDEGEPEQRKPSNSRYMALTGISDLDMFKWMLLFHIADIVTMQQFITQARKEVPAQVNEVFVQIFDHFRITENQNAVPIGY
jgi:hypothetical protein